MHLVRDQSNVIKVLGEEYDNLQGKISATEALLAKEALFGETDKIHSNIVNAQKEITRAKAASEFVKRMTSFKFDYTDPKDFGLSVELLGWSKNNVNSSLYPVLSQIGGARQFAELFGVELPEMA